MIASPLARPSRRRFLGQGAAVTVAFTLAPYFEASAQSVGGSPPTLPGSLQTNRQLDAWLAINADGTVTVFTGKVELGQGITTALAQIVADELDVDFSRIVMISGDTSRTPNEGVTSGSLSIEQGGTALRFAAAEAREILLTAAAAKLGVPASDLVVADGVITAPNDKRTSYWEVTRADMLRREATAKAKPRPCRIAQGDRKERRAPRHSRESDGRRRVRAGHAPCRGCCSVAWCARRRIARSSPRSTTPRRARCPA